MYEEYYTIKEGVVKHITPFPGTSAEAIYSAISLDPAFSAFFDLEKHTYTQLRLLCANFAWAMPNFPGFALSHLKLIIKGIPEKDIELYYNKYVEVINNGVLPGESVQLNHIMFCGNDDTFIAAGIPVPTVLVEKVSDKLLFKAQCDVGVSMRARILAALVPDHKSTDHCLIVYRVGAGKAGASYVRFSAAGEGATLDKTEANTLLNMLVSPKKVVSYTDDEQQKVKYVPFSTTTGNIPLISGASYYTFEARVFGSPNYYTKSIGGIFENSFRAPIQIARDIPFPNIEKLLKHLCCDTPEYYDFCLEYFALTIQNIYKYGKVVRPHSYIFHTGAEHSGKNAKEQIWRLLLGENNCGSITKDILLEGKDNGVLATKLYLLWDEAACSSTEYPQLSSNLKKMITNDTGPVRLLYKGSVDLPYTFTLEVYANPANGFRIESADSRATILRQPDSLISKYGVPFLSELRAALSDPDGEICGFFKHLMGLKLQWEDRKTLNTEAKTEAKTATANVYERFAYALSGKVDTGFLKDAFECVLHFSVDKNATHGLCVPIGKFNEFAEKFVELSENMYAAKNIKKNRINGALTAICKLDKDSMATVVKIGDKPVRCVVGLEKLAGFKEAYDELHTEKEETF